MKKKKKKKPNTSLCILVSSSFPFLQIIVWVGVSSPSKAKFAFKHIYLFHNNFPCLFHQMHYKSKATLNAAYNRKTIRNSTIQITRTAQRLNKQKILFIDFLLFLFKKKIKFTINLKKRIDEILVFCWQQATLNCSHRSSHTNTIETFVILPALLLKTSKSNNLRAKKKKKKIKNSHLLFRVEQSTWEKIQAYSVRSMNQI